MAPETLTRPDGSPVRVLVVDDEVNIAELISMALRYEGWDISTAHNGTKAVRLAKEQKPDAIVLDVMLPDVDGFEVLRRIRTNQPDVPVLFLTARDAVEDRVAGLTAGGDDYVTKPFSIEELVARLRGLMRRAGARRAEAPDVPVLFLTARDAVEDRIAGLTAGGDDYVTKPFSLEELVARLRGLLRRAGMAAARQGSELVVGDLVLDEDSREVRRGNDLVELTATEFELLRYLMRNPRRVLSKAQILDRVWSYDFGGQSNVVELYISYLRKKIDAGRQPMIHPVRGAGYVLKPAAD
jgi:two-component system OmpR family response regulator